MAESLLFSLPVNGTPLPNQTWRESPNMGPIQFYKYEALRWVCPVGICFDIALDLVKHPDGTLIEKVRNGHTTQPLHKLFLSEHYVYTGKFRGHYFAGTNPQRDQYIVQCFGIEKPPKPNPGEEIRIELFTVYVNGNPTPGQEWRESLDFYHEIDIKFTSLDWQCPENIEFAIAVDVKHGKDKIILPQVKNGQRTSTLSRYHGLDYDEIRGYYIGGSVPQGNSYYVTCFGIL